MKRNWARTDAGWRENFRYPFPAQGDIILLPACRYACHSTPTWCTLVRKMDIGGMQPMNQGDGRSGACNNVCVWFYLDLWSFLSLIVFDLPTKQPSPGRIPHARAPQPETRIRGSYVFKNVSQQGPGMLDSLVGGRRVAPLTERMGYCPSRPIDSLDAAHTWRGPRT